MRESLQEGVEEIWRLDEKRYEQEAVWLRQILTLSAGALAILAGLGPPVSSEGFAQYFLAATWAFLGMGIASGAAATYLVVNRANKLALSYREKLAQKTRERDESAFVIYAPRNPWLSRCKPMMICSLLGAVLCVTAYAIVTTLGG